MCGARQSNALQRTRDFYDPATEQRLNRQVEIPGGDAIDTILASQPLTREAFVDIIIHVGTMLRRVPFYRKWAKEFSGDIMPERWKSCGNMAESGFANWPR